MTTASMSTSPNPAAGDNAPSAVGPSRGAARTPPRMSGSWTAASTQTRSISAPSAWAAWYCRSQRRRRSGRTARRAWRRSRDLGTAGAHRLHRVDHEHPGQRFLVAEVAVERAVETPAAATRSSMRVLWQPRSTKTSRPVASRAIERAVPRRHPERRRQRSPSSISGRPTSAGGGGPSGGCTLTPVSTPEERAMQDVGDAPSRLGRCG